MEALEHDVEAFEDDGVAPEEVLEWAFAHFHPGMALSVAGGQEGVSVLDMAVRVRPDVRVFTLDTGKLHPETQDLFSALETRYEIEIERVHPDDGQVSRMVKAFGEDLMYEGVNLRAPCCQIRKVLPLNRVLTGLDAWMTGIRRQQTATRASVQKVEIDTEHGGIVKVNPIADWTKEQVLAYAEDHDLPSHPLVAQGYPSVGCAPCTRAVASGDDERSGRWWWETDAPKECGLHARPVGALDFELEQVMGGGRP